MPLSVAGTLFGGCLSGLKFGTSHGSGWLSGNGSRVSLGYPNRAVLPKHPVNMSVFLSALI